MRATQRRVLLLLATVTALLVFGVGPLIAQAFGPSGVAGQGDRQPAVVELNEPAAEAGVGAESQKASASFAAEPEPAATASDGKAVDDPSGVSGVPSDARRSIGGDDLAAAGLRK